MANAFHDDLNTYNFRLPLLVYGDAITDWQPQDCHLIRIDCDEDLTWPGIAWRIIKGLEILDNQQFPVDLLDSYYMDDWIKEYSQEGPFDLFFLDGLEQRNFQWSFLGWISNLFLRRKVCILINDLHRLDDEDTFVLSWLPVELPENLSVICTTKSTEMVQNGRILGWFQTQKGNPSSLPVRQFPAAWAQFRQVLSEPDSLRKKHQLTQLARKAVSHCVEMKDYNRLQELMTDMDILEALAPMAWHVIRRSWMELLIHTDTDMVETHLDLLNRLMDAGKGHLILQMGKLSKDLGFSRGQNRLSFYTRKPLRVGSFERDLSLLRPDFKALFERLDRLRRLKDYQLLHNETAQYLSNKDLLDSEICIILYFRVLSSSMLPRSTFMADANAYYEAALKCGSCLDVYQATQFLANSLQKNCDYADAVDLYRICVETALRIGDLRTLVMSKRSMAQCLCKLQKYDEATQIYGFLRDTFRRMEHPQEHYQAWMDLCDVAVASGDAKGALENALMMERTFPEKKTTSIELIQITLQGRIGSYYVALKEYDLAEEPLKQCLYRARQISARRHALQWLIRLYDETGRITAAVSTYRSQLTRHWNWRNYDELVHILTECLEFLQNKRLVAMAAKLQRHWEDQLITLRDMRYMEDLLHWKTRQQQRINARMNELMQVQQAGNNARFVELAIEIAPYYYETERRKAASLLLMAAQLQINSGQIPAVQQTLAEAMVYLVEHGSFIDRDLWHGLYKMPLDRDLKRILLNWQEAGQYLSEDGRSPILTDHNFGDVPEILDQVFRAGAAYPYTAIGCLTDLAPLVFGVFTAKQIHEKIRLLDKDNAERLSMALCDHILDRMVSDLPGLMKAADAPEAAVQIEFFQKAAKLLTMEGHEDAGKLHSDLAIIYRKRKDLPSACLSHEQAIKAAVAAKDERQKWSEMLELANTALHFGRAEDAISTLRSGLVEAVKAEDQRFTAFFAGKLAHVLIEHGGYEHWNEIDRLFILEADNLKACGMYQELGRALLAQAEYYSNRNSGKYYFLSKLEQAYKILRRFVMNAEMERLEALRPKAQKALRIYTTRIMAGLVAEVGGYQIFDGKTLENGAFYYMCKQADNPAASNETMHMVALPALDGDIGIIMESTADRCPQRFGLLQEYAAYWNEKGQYPLEIVDNSVVFQAILSIKRTNQEEMAQKIRQFLCLWRMDRQVIDQLAKGQIDLQQAIKIKEDALASQA